MNLNKFLQKYSNISNYAYSTNETKLNSYLMGKYVAENNINGCIVECGVAAAANFAFMMLGYQTHSNIKKTYYGFDSFCGIQLAGVKDDVQPGIGKINHDVNVPDKFLLKSSGITSVSKNDVIANLKRWNLFDENVILVEGWIQETITPNIIKKINQISILRLDMDIYAPTKFALDKLYPLIPVGGVVIIDDWALLGARTACVEYFNEHNINPNLKTVDNSTPVYFIKEFL